MLEIKTEDCGSFDWFKQARLSHSLMPNWTCQGVKNGLTEWTRIGMEES
jgi:hypothetical protein